MALAYLLRKLVSASVFTASDGLIDHALSEEIFWFSWQPLFRPSMGLAAVQAVIVAACLPAVGIIVGMAPRRCALALYAVVVCLYRHDLLVIFVDDVLVHLLLFWLFLLPVGRTLTLRGWRGGPEERAGWLDAQAPGLTVRLFLINVALIYVVAGVTKWMSPMWRSGEALYAILQLPAGWMPGFWAEAHRPWLRPLNWAALVMEPMFVGLFVLPARGWGKRALLVAWAMFHVVIVVTLDIPFANLGCLAVAPLFMRQEVMSLLGRPHATSKPGTALPGWSWTERFAATVLALLIGAMALSVTQVQWRTPSADGPVRGAAAEAGTSVQRVLYGALYAVGLAQSYRLVDWIDQRNFAATVDVVERRQGRDDRRGDSRRLFPRGMRGGLILSYVLEVTWMPVPDESRDRLRESIVRRMGRRYCAQSDDAFDVVADITVIRVDPPRPSNPVRSSLLRVRCEGGRVASGG